MGKCQNDSGGLAMVLPDTVQPITTLNSPTFPAVHDSDTTLVAEQTSDTAMEPNTSNTVENPVELPADVGSPLVEAKKLHTNGLAAIPENDDQSEKDVTVCEEDTSTISSEHSNSSSEQDPVLEASVVLKPAPLTGESSEKQVIEIKREEMPTPPKDGIQDCSTSDKGDIPSKLYKTIHFHRDGDMYVRAKNHQGEFVLYDVLSACLAAASPVWRKIIYGGAHCRPASGHWVLDLLEDDHLALFVIFKLIHYHYYDMPQRPNVDRFYSICTVAEKYDCVHLFVPYMKEWIGDLDWHVIMANGHNDDDKTLWITWIFGDPKWFSKMLNKVSQKATVDENGDLRDCAGQLWKNLALPSQLLELIAETRERGLKDVLNAVNKPLVSLMFKKRDADSVVCRAKEQQDECEAMVLGSTISALVQAGLWPLPAPESYKGSVKALADRLLRLKIQHFAVPGVRPHLDSHGPCGLGHREAILAALESQVRLSGYLTWRLEQQAIKSGAYDADKFKDYRAVADSCPIPADVKRDLAAKTGLEEDVLRVCVKAEEE